MLAIIADIEANVIAPDTAIVAAIVNHMAYEKERGS
jgi:hypothetical protein